MKHLQQGDTDLIVTSPLHDGDPANPQNGLAATTLLRIYRASDRYFYDFNDSTFKASGHTAITQAMALLDATNAPGVYYYAWTTPAADDTYHYVITETSATAKNVPQTGEVFVGDWVDDIQELEAGNIPADVDTLLARLTAARAAALDEVTAARLAELDAANLPADVDTLLARLTAARAGYLDELNAPNIPADVDTLLSRLTAGRATNLDNLDATVSSRASHSAADVDTQLSGTHGGGSWEGDSGLTAQDVRDAMKLAPTGGAPAAGSIDQHLDDIEAGLLDSSAVQAACTAALTAYGTATEANVDAAEAAILAAIGALENLSQAQAQAACAAALTAYDAATATDVSDSTSTIVGSISALENLSQAEAQSACAAALSAYGAATAGNVSTAETNILAAIAALNDIDSAAVQAACTAALTAFDCATEANVSAQGAAVLAAVGALENLSQAEAQSACAAALAALGFQADSGDDLKWLYRRFMNRLELSPAGRWELYDDAGTTVITYWDPVTDRTGDPIALAAGAPARRPAGVVI